MLFGEVGVRRKIVGVSLPLARSSDECCTLYTHTCNLLHRNVCLRSPDVIQPTFGGKKRKEKLVPPTACAALIQ